MSSIFFKRRLSGRDYRIKVFRFAKRCQVTLQDIITSSTWKGNFDQACIETMTRKTGRFMPFEMFFSLLLASLRDGLCEAQLSVMTFRDLQNLFKEDVSATIARQMDEENRRYFILTVNQPMITHYPLPLLYCQYPDTELMTMTKQELQNNMAATADNRPNSSPQHSSPTGKRIIRKKERAAELPRPRSRKISFGKGDFLERVMGEQIEKVLNESFGHSHTEQETVESLRMELREQAREFKREMTRLRRENERLRRRLEEMKIHEMEMAAEIVRLTERQRLNLPLAAAGKRPDRCRSSSPQRRRSRRRPGSASTASLLSHSPRPVHSMFNFFETDEAALGRRLVSADRRRSSPAVRSQSADRGRRLQAQMRSKSLDDARAGLAPERYLCSPGRRCYRPRDPAASEPESGADWRPWGDAPPRPRAWTPFDPSQYVAERREALRQRSLERELLRQRPAPRPPARARLRRKSGGRATAQPADQPPPPPPPPPPDDAWEDVGDSAVVGMRQLETRLKNLQRMLAEKLS